MIINHIQNDMRILMRFNDETKLVEFGVAHKDMMAVPEPWTMDYKECDQLAHTLDRMSLAYNQAMDAEVVIALEGFGIKPETSPADPERRDLVLEAMEKAYGPRCRHPEPGCLACEAYRQLDVATEPAPLLLVVPMGGPGNGGNIG